ncbi:uncharacterized protein LOC114769497 isoform X2 [Denticeps clupeoides]|uniref:uncharacterized protein LOC114769497 isoform X2 n=1 Tax=Denticeps clupeoides TaxID=299321 RepID=UPI0010A3582F|nr:uncharacterized protein LOC114769497 isoform X2 [Denticeps clupeoides]
MMDSDYELLSEDCCAQPCKVIIPEASECFICREGQLGTREPIRTFCDCRSLLAHHHCLLTWISKYQLERRSAWLLVAARWRTWLVLAAFVSLLALAPYTSYRMLTAFRDPPPDPLFKAAAVCFGLLSVTLLIMGLFSYFRGEFRKAQHCAFTVHPRQSDEGDVMDWPGSGPPLTWMDQVKNPGPCPGLKK